MSRDFHFRCVTCDPPSNLQRDYSNYAAGSTWGYGADLNWQGDKLLDLLPHFPLFAELGRTGFDVSPESLNLYGGYQPAGLAEYAWNHDGHDVRVWDEYGQEWTRSPLLRLVDAFTYIVYLLEVQKNAVTMQGARDIVDLSWRLQRR